MKVESDRNRAQSRRERREWFFAAQDGRCFHCGELMVLGGEGQLSATFDHIVRPRRQKRSNKHDHADNTALAHAYCNNLRGDAEGDAISVARVEKLWADYNAFRAARKLSKAH